MKKGFAVFLLAASTGVSLAAPGFVPIELTTYPIATFAFGAIDRAVGVIEFRGGFSIVSNSPDFGALSGLEILPDGTLVAISDTGFWMTARIVEENGWLRGLAGARFAPILDADGEEANRKGNADAEGLRLAEDGRSLLVSFEQLHRLSRYDLAGDLAFSTPTRVALPTLTGVAGNRGIEAVAVAPLSSALAGATVIFAERAKDDAGNVRAWVLGGPMAGSFGVRTSGEFDITDAAFLPNGDLLILERRFSMSQGIAMRIRRLSANDIRPGAAVTGPTILYDDHLFQIDNMEGMALRPQPDGEVIITLLSDDNHSILQRTLILQFAYREAAPPLPVLRP